MPGKSIWNHRKKKVSDGNKEKKAAYESLDELEERIAREKRKAKNSREAKTALPARVSYVKKPFAKNSLYAIGLAVTGLLLLGLGLYGAVRTQGQAGLNVGALGFSSLLVGIVAVWYGVKSFSEKDMNYILAKIGSGIGMVLVLVWCSIIIIGIRG